MASYVALRRQSQALYHQGDSIGALQILLRLIEAHPADHALRLHIGDALAGLGLRTRAAQIYAAVGLHQLNGGRPLQALAAVCALRKVAANAEAVVDTMANMYGSGSSKVVREMQPPPPPAPPQLDLPESSAALPPGELLHALLAQDPGEEALATPDALPPLPILSDLDRKDLATVLRGVRRRRIPDGESLIVQGEAGRSIYLVAHGGVRVQRRENGQLQTLARLGPGAILGEMALVTRSRRSATVTAMGDVDAIEIPIAALMRIAGDSRGVSAALEQFTRNRLLRNTVMGSRIFQPFLPDRLGEILPKFQNRDYREGDDLLVEGTQGPGLFVILTGECAITHAEGDGTTELARVGPGDVVGEMSLLSEQPTTATVRATQTTLTLFFERDAFLALLDANPEIRDELTRIEEARAVVNAFVLDDGFESDEADLEEEEEIFL